MMIYRYTYNLVYTSQKFVDVDYTYKSIIIFDLITIVINSVIID